MIKTYRVRCELNMCADKVETVYIKTNLCNKAIQKAEEEMKKRGCFHVKVISCEEVTEKKA